MTKLEGVHPDLKAKVLRMMNAFAELGCPVMVTDGVRTLKQQQALYAKGRTQPGPRVTNADGVRHKSNHQVKDDGFGHAVDFAFLDAAGKPTWEGPWALLGEMAEQQGLVWGGRWTKLVDRPHVELP